MKNYLLTPLVIAFLSACPVRALTLTDTLQFVSTSSDSEAASRMAELFTFTAIEQIRDATSLSYGHLLFGNNTASAVIIGVYLYDPSNLMVDRFKIGSSMSGPTVPIFGVPDDIAAVFHADGQFCARDDDGTFHLDPDLNPMLGTYSGDGVQPGGYFGLAADRGAFMPGMLMAAIEDDQIRAGILVQCGDELATFVTQRVPDGGQSFVLLGISLVPLAALKRRAISA